MTAVLWHIEVSHYNEKVRWALEHKGIPYELRTPMPGTHRLTALRLTRGRHDRLPILELEGRRIGDSTAIIAALEEHRPEPRLYPDEPAERERALEDYFRRGACAVRGIRSELGARRGGRWVAEMYARHRAAPVAA